GRSVVEDRPPLPCAGARGSARFAHVSARLFPAPVRRTALQAAGRRRCRLFRRQPVAVPDAGAVASQARGRRRMNAAVLKAISAVYSTRPVLEATNGLINNYVLYERRLQRA